MSGFIPNMLLDAFSGWAIAGYIALVVALIAVIIFLIFRKPKYAPEPTRELTVTETLVGMIGTVVECVDGDAGTGLVEINGEGWAARSIYSDDVYRVGDEVTVVAVEGVKVIVKPK